MALSRTPSGVRRSGCARTFSTSAAERIVLGSRRSCVRNTCRTPGAKNAPFFAVVTTPTAEQQRAMDLLVKINV